MPSASPPPRRSGGPALRGIVSSVGVFSSLRVRNYRLYATGAVVSLVGTWMQVIAQDWLVLDLSGDSGAALGAATALQFGPMLVLTLWAGVLADRFDKRKLLLVSQAAMGLLSAAMGLLVVAGVARLWHVMVFAALLGVANAFDTPTRQAFVSELVGADLLPNAVGLNSATFNVARIVGPAVGGLVIAGLGVGPAFLLNAATFAGTLIALATLRPRELFRVRPSERPDARLADGLRYVGRRPDLLLVIALVFVVGSIGMSFNITLPLLAKVEFGVGAAAFGLLNTALAVGALAGALVGSRRRDRPRARTVLTFAAVFGAFELAVAFTPTFSLTVALLLPTGAFLIAHNTAANARTQLGAPADLRGRVMALYTLVFLGSAPLGALLVGAVNEWFGARTGMAACGATVVLSAGVLALLRARRRREGTRRAAPAPAASVVNPAGQ